MYQIANLHTHTFYSDGVLSPASVVRKATEHNISVLAITDHDCIDGVEEATETGLELGVSIVTGVELSVTVDGVEVHLLGYNFDPLHAGIRSHLDSFRKIREKRARKMVDKLNEQGVPVSWEAVRDEANGSVIGRPHIATAMISGGFVSTWRDAFNLYLSDKGPAFVAKPLFAGKKALSLLHDAGGIGVLAHPGNWTSDRTIMRLIRDGLDGIETIHPSHTPELTDYYRRLTRDFHLLQTGGSDYHGRHDREEEHFAAFTIPTNLIKKMWPAAVS